MKHINRAYPCQTKVVEGAKYPDFQGDVFTKAVVTEKAQNIFSWLKTLIGGLKLFTFNEKKFVSKNMKMQPICYKTLCKYMPKVTKYVEGKVSHILPDKFALVFDSRSVGSRYMMAVFASFPCKYDKEYDLFVLSFPTFKNKTSHTACKHKA